MKKNTSKKKALIEGKFAAKFLLRLLPDENKQLEKIQADDSIKTGTGAVKKAIYGYNNYKELYRDTVKEYQILKLEHDRLLNIVNFFSASLSEVINYKEHTEPKTNGKSPRKNRNVQLTIED